MSARRHALVYFLASAGLVKIGSSTNVDQRVRELRAMGAASIDLLLVLPGGEAFERALHAHFSERRDHGEWFALPAGWVKDAKALCHARLAEVGWRERQRVMATVPVDFGSLLEASAASGRDTNEILQMLGRGEILTLDPEEIRDAIPWTMADVIGPREVRA